MGIPDFSGLGFALLSLMLYHITITLLLILGVFFIFKGAKIENKKRRNLGILFIIIAAILYFVVPYFLVPRF